MKVEEYLHTAFPDVDYEYRDGAISSVHNPIICTARRRVLLSPSSFTGWPFTTAISPGNEGLGLSDRLSLYPRVETRMRIRPSRYLIPDVAVFYPVEPSEVPLIPPLVAIEVLSPDDRMSEVREKLDPRLRRFYVCDGGLIEQSTLRIPGLGIELTTEDIFR